MNKLFKHHWIIYLNIYSFLTLFIDPYLRIKLESILIDENKIRIKRGLINKRSTTIFLSSIRNIYVTQGIIGRTLNYGNIVISTSRGKGFFLKKIKDVKQLEERITHLRMTN